MTRLLALTGFTVALMACAPAMAQQAPPELDGAPGSHAADMPPPLRVPPKGVAKPQPSAKTKAEQAKLSQQAEAQKAEQARLARQAEDLKALQAKLDARAAELAAEEKRIDKLRADAATQQAAENRRLAQLQADAQARLVAQQDKLAAQQAELTKKQQEAARVAAIAERPAPSVRQAEADAASASEISEAVEAPSRDLRQPSSPRLVFAAARRSCTWAGEQAARARDYEDAQYDDEPRLYQRDGWELRGRMRLQDRRGYRLVDTVCEVDDAGEVQHFALLR